MFEYFLGLRVTMLFDVILHMGTLFVTFLFFRGEIKDILIALAHRDFETESGKLIPRIIVGTIPTALMGLLFSELMETAFQTLLPLALAFIVCGAILYSSKVGKERKDTLDYSTAFILGIAQGVAIMPGISRSGATIAVALLLGVRREKAFRFSFLLSIPAIIGALGLTLLNQYSELAAVGLGGIGILAGMIAAMLVGYLALRLLWKILAKKRIHIFAFYCWTLGVALMIFSQGVF